LKKFAFAALAVLTTCLAIEIGARVLFALRVGPSVLLYGTSFEREGMPQPGANPAAGRERAEIDRKHTVMVHRNEQRGYSKYYPNQERVDFDQTSGESFEVGINSHGFRGEEFSRRKAHGVVRIVTLGASSTFGYYSRDEQTYPFRLEQELNDACRDTQRYEVINLGVPHLLSQNITALFLTEGLGLDPDIVTFYEGVNDTNAVVQQLNLNRAGQRSAPARWMQRAGRRLGEHFITVGFARSLLERRSVPFSGVDFEHVTRRVSTRFFNNLEQIRSAADHRGAQLLVATQQASSTTLDPAEMSSTSYEGEVERVRARVDATGRALPAEIRLLAHQVLMQDLIAWADSRQVPWVDGISALDDDRSVLSSWVHLTPTGNLKLARAFADPILLETCTDIAFRGDER
jgi:hypothetical protein